MSARKCISLDPLPTFYLLKGGWSWRATPSHAQDKLLALSSNSYQSFCIVPEEHSVVLGIRPKSNRSNILLVLFLQLSLHLLFFQMYLHFCKHFQSLTVPVKYLMLYFWNVSSCAQFPLLSNCLVSPSSIPLMKELFLKNL